MTSRRLVTITFFCLLTAMICGQFVQAQTGLRYLLATIDSHYVNTTVNEGFTPSGSANEELDIYADAIRDWDLEPGRTAGMSGLWAVDRVYFGQLCYTLANALIAAIVVLFLIYCLAFLRDYCHVKGFTKAAGFIVTPFDLIPYILWIFPILAITRVIFSLEPFMDSDYLWEFFVNSLNQTLIYTGFSMFLIPFFSKRNNDET